MRTNQEYILLRHPVKMDIRNEILAETPQEFGGCQGCKYWTACYGGCPSGAINNDWRNRTYLCPLWKALFQYFENVLKIVEYPTILPRGGCGQREQIPTGGHGDSEHGDWTDSNHGDSAHGDEIQHGDAPHGDWGDHQDL